MKQYLKPYAYKESELQVGRKAGGVTAFLLKNEPTSLLHVARLSP